MEITMSAALIWDTLYTVTVKGYLDFCSELIFGLIKPPKLIIY